MQSNQYISSEESCTEDDATDDCEGKLLLKHRLPWRSDWLNERFERLDKQAKYLNKEKGTSMLKRKIGVDSEREEPENSYVWAVAEFMDVSGDEGL